MKIRLIADDSKIPNFAIMKISSYHKLKGDNVDWYNHILDYEDTDILYISKIFSFTSDIIYLPINAKTIKGGTGYDHTIKLPDEIENIIDLDYSLYPKCDYSILFTTRGCIRNCPFCIVPKKEGMIHNVQIVNLNPKGKYIELLDNNFFANKTWRENINELKRLNQPINFNSGIDLRLLNKEQCEALSKLKIKGINCAFDNFEDKEIIMPKLKMLCEYIKPSKIRCYVLIGFKQKHLVEEDIKRVNMIWELGVYPFVMIYQDFNNSKDQRQKDCKDFARWCNNRFIFKSCNWEDYRKGKENGTSVRKIKNKR